MLDRFAGVPAPDGSPPVASWLADVLDDLAGLPPRHGLLRDAGVQLPGIDPSTGRALTFGDLWLGRPDRRDGDDERLRRAARDPEHRVVDLRLVATDVTWGRPVRLPLGPGWLFCPSCLRGGVPARAIDQLVAAAPPPQGKAPVPGGQGPAAARPGRRAGARRGRRPARGGPGGIAAGGPALPRRRRRRPAGAGRVRRVVGGR